MSSPDELGAADSDVEMNENNPTRDTIENMLYFDRDVNTKHLLEQQEKKEKRKERKEVIKNNYKQMLEYFKNNSEVVIEKANELRRIMNDENIFNTMTSKQRVDYLFYALQNDLEPRSLYNWVIKRGGKKKKKRKTRRKKKRKTKRKKKRKRKTRKKKK